MSETKPLPEELTVNDIVEMGNRALDRMSNTNPHKRLIYFMGTAIVKISDRCTDLEAELESMRKRIKELEERNGAAQTATESENARA